MQSVVITGGTTIWDYAFDGCSHISSIAIPNGVTAIGVAAFNGCKALSDVSIPNTVTTVGRWAFSETAWYESQPDGVIYVGKVAYYYKDEMSNNSAVSIVEGTTAISDYAFSWYGDGLTSITIPDSVKYIGTNAFMGCSTLTDIYFDGTKAQWNAVDKQGSWDANSGDYTIHCTDGDIAKA